MSRIQFKIVNKIHSICSQSSFDWAPGMVPSAAKKFYNSCAWDECDYAVIASLKNEIIGIFRYSVTKRKLFATGTWVATKFRRNKIGIRMWEKALNANPGLIVDVYCAHNKSYAMIEKIAAKYKNTLFCTHKCWWPYNSSLLLINDEN